MRKRLLLCSALREISEFFPLLHPIKRQVALAVMLGLLLPLLTTALLACLGTITDSVLSSEGAVELGKLGLVGLLCVSVALLKAIINYLDRILDTNVVERVTQGVRQNLFEHSLALSPGSLQGSASQVPDLVARMGVDSERIAALIYGIPLGVLTDCCAAFSIVGFLVFTSWNLTAVGQTLLPLVYFIIARGGSRVRAASNFARRRYSGWMNLADVALGEADFVNLSGARARESRRFSQRCSVARASELLAVKAQARVELKLDLLMIVGGGAVLAVAIGEVRSGRLTPGAVVSFLAAIHLVCAPIKSLGQASTRFQRASASAGRIREIMQTKSLVVDYVESAAGEPSLAALGEASREERARLPGEQAREVLLELANVSFSYPGAARQALRNLSLEIVQGRVTAIVGPNGCGKSTLSKLCLRLYDPSAGSIRLRSQNLQDLSLTEVRNRIGIMLQDAPIILGSVADNIGYGVSELNQTDIEAVAHAVGLHRAVCALPRGYRTIIGGSASVFSRGMQQRLGLARLLLQKPELLILDEATASMDGENEDLVSQLISSLKGEQTILVIAHRIASVRTADYLYVMDEGEIAEQGAPTALLQSGKRCHSLFASQMIQSPTLEISGLCL